MIDNTTKSILNMTNNVISAVQQQNQNYLELSIFSILASFAIYFLIFSIPISNKIQFVLVSFNLLKRAGKLANRNIIVMSHRGGGFFGSMITMEDAYQFEKLIRKFNNKGIDFIINTYGGELFASMRIAILVRNHPDMRIIVPKFAWSGGSLITIATDKIMMGKLATVSPVDVQLGSFLKTHSGKNWEYTLNYKKNKASDDTVAMAELSKDLLREQGIFLSNLFKDRPTIDKHRAFEMFLTGDYSHGNQITINDMKQMGFQVKEIDTDIYDRIIEKTRRSGVFGYHNKGQRGKRID